ncbi:MAG: hypothetical protein PHE01_11510 [Methanosarcina sp.]|nr:hypothetical protein [Methanosarcina sp.]
MAGDLKLAYSQFEELVAFTRFGARLDENTRKIIEHGRRIRALLNQQEFFPVPVPDQIVILLALNAKFFDSVPLDKMGEAEQSLRKAVADIPTKVRERFNTDAELSDEDRKTVLEIARKALARFQPGAESEAEPEAETKGKLRSEAKTEDGSKSEAKTEGESKPETQTEGNSKPEAEKQS